VEVAEIEEVAAMVRAGAKDAVTAGAGDDALGRKVARMMRRRP